MDIRPDNCKKCNRPLTSDEALLNEAGHCKTCQGIALYRSMQKGYKVRPYQSFRPKIVLR